MASSKTKKVSIIIPCFNDGIYLKDAIDSVKEQGFKEYELIIVDDGSTNSETLNILTRIDLNAIRLIRKTNGGPGSARNLGVSEATGQYILTLDADDKLDSNYLVKTVMKLDNASTDIAFINTWWKLFGEKEGISVKGEYDPYNLAWENIVGNNCLFKKTVWEEVGGYSTNLDGIEDWDFWIKIVTKGYKWELVREPLMHYRVRGGSLSKSNGKRIRELGLILLENNKQFFLENYKEIYLRGNLRWYNEYQKNIDSRF